MLSIAIALAAAAPARLPPVELCGGDAEFSQVRRQLEQAVAARDEDGLVALMSDDVRFSFGGGVGRDGFKQHWSAAPQEQAQLWTEFGRAMKLGCAKAVDGQGKEYRAMPAMLVAQISVRR